MRETRSSGSVEGVMSNRDPYSDYDWKFGTRNQSSNKSSSKQSRDAHRVN